MFLSFKSYIMDNKYIFDAKRYILIKNNNIIKSIKLNILWPLEVKYLQNI